MSKIDPNSNTPLYTRKKRMKQKRKMKKRTKFILIPIIIAFLSVLTYAGVIFVKANMMLTDSYEDDGRGKSALRKSAVDPKFDNVSILIMGIDASEKRENVASDSRTDALMLATLNKDDKSIKLLSIPRDSYVYLPSEGYSTKINHAHAHGGTKGAVETVENLLDVPVDYYVKVNFEAFIDIVEALNGIDIDVPYEFKEQDSKDRPNRIHLQPGMQRLNGEEALALARTRKLDNDIERGKRQQEIVKSIMDRAVSLDSLLKYDKMIEAIGNNMTTNLKPSEVRSLVSYGLGGNLTVETLTLEGRDYQPAGTYYWQINETALIETKRELQQHLDVPIKAENETKEEGRTETFHAAPTNESSHP